MSDTRTEHDTLGPVRVPANRLWGAQTQRAVVNFRISTETMPDELVRALVRVKQAAARANAELKALPPEKADAIAQAADEVLSGLHGDEFPLPVWQTGSGTMTNMNVNEVLANRASELLGGARGEGRLVHPNDDVNQGQSSNDAVPTALNVAALDAVVRQVLPALSGLRDALQWKAQTFAEVVKVGRTHLMDATPLTVGQELSGWVAQLDQAVRHIELTLPHLSELAIGGTAVGTGLNARPGFAARVVELLGQMLELPFAEAPNRFEAVSASDAVVHAHGALKGLAMSLMKIANDVRLLASGPRTGIGELSLPDNEPGSSIMPGKVNPTQCEMLTMVAAQVLGNDVALSVAGGSGQLQLNTYRPLLAHGFLQSCRLLADGMRSFTRHCVEGLEVNRAAVDKHLGQSLMLVTALSPHLGYEAAAAIAHHAHKDGLTLKQAALDSGKVTAEQFDEWVQPQKMVGEG